MIEVMSDVFNVPLALATVLTLQESNSYQRTFVFKNIYTATLSFRIEHSADGGATWAIVVSSFDVDSGDIAVKNVADSYGGMIRVVGSGGTSSGYQAYIAAARVYDSSVRWNRAII